MVLITFVITQECGGGLCDYFIMTHDVSQDNTVHVCACQDVEWMDEEGRLQLPQREDHVALTGISRPTIPCLIV